MPFLEIPLKYNFYNSNKDLFTENELYDFTGVIIGEKYWQNNLNLINIKNVLDKNEIISTITIETREGKKLKTPQGIESITFKDMYRLNISSKSIKTNFKDYLYNNASIFLTRKKEIFFKENTEVN